MYDRRYGSNRFRKLLSTLAGRHPERNEFWALQGVSFRLGEGESLGIIGPNGSGKTTILRILSGISYIDRGHVKVRGTISALIALGAGFHPELTGRENVYLNGSIIGLSRGEIRRYFDHIVDFAGIGDYIDSPVKRYSSGMYVRLGFAVAAQMRPDILLIDEVLAVGDARFQARCHERIRELRRDGTIIILVSHDLWAVRQLCGQGILLRHGKVTEHGDISTVIGAYNKTVQEAAMRRLDDARGHDDDHALSASCDLEFRDAAGAKVSEIELGCPLTIRVYYRCDQPVPHPTLTIAATAHNGPCAMVLRSNKVGWSVDALQGEGHIDVTIPQAHLNPGRYAVQCSIKDEKDMVAWATSRFRELYIRPPDAQWASEEGASLPSAEWSSPTPGN